MACSRYYIEMDEEITDCKVLITCEETGQKIIEIEFYEELIKNARFLNKKLFNKEDINSLLNYSSFLNETNLYLGDRISLLLDYIMVYINYNKDIVNLSINFTDDNGLIINDKFTFQPHIDKDLKSNIPMKLSFN